MMHCLQCDSKVDLDIHVDDGECPNCGYPTSQVGDPLVQNSNMERIKDLLKEIDLIRPLSNTD